MTSIAMSKLPTNNYENAGETAEEEPCLPQSANSNRKSMEFLNKNRENEEQNNSYVQDSEKGKRTESRTTQPVRKPNRFATIKFNPQPSKFEKWCTEKTGLSRFGLIIQGLVIVLLLILLLIVIIMSCLWPTLPHSLLFPVCRTSACLLASSEVLTKMNQSIDPCEDIRDYACGHWFNSHSIPLDKSEWGLKQHLQHKHREKIRDMINTLPNPEDLTSVEFKVKNIYDSCMSVGTIETEGHRPLEKLITLLGGWKVLRTFFLQQFDMHGTLTNLHSKYNVQPFFKVDVVPDAQAPHQSIIRISPGNLGLPDKSYYKRRADDRVVQGYKNFLKDVVMTLGATTDHASLFSEEMYGFEQRLCERFPTFVSDKPGQYRPTIAKLEEIAPSVPFFDILSAMFPYAKLTKKSEVLIIASDHLVNVSAIISTTERGVLNDYMMWRLAVDYLPYLSKKYRNALNEFHRHLYGFKEPKPRWEMCVETLQKFMGFGLEAMLENLHADPDRKRRVVKDVFSGITDVSKKAIEQSNNLPLHIQTHFVEKMEAIKIQVGLPDYMLHPNAYNKHYMPLSTIKSDFFQNVLHGVRFMLDEQKKRLIEPNDEDRWVDIISDGNLKIMYVPELNKVIVPLGTLAMPYFHHHYPLSVLYGGIGSEIGLAVLSSVTGKGLLHAGDGVILPSDHPVCNVTHDCFLNHPLATPYLEAIKYTFQALQLSLENMPHVHQPAMEYLEDQAIFFIAYAQSLCTMKTPERKDIEATVKSQLNDVSILQMVMTKSKQFSKTFGCSSPLQKDTCDTLI